MSIALVALPALAAPGLDLARGWYLWETGRDHEAHELASTLAGEHPDDPSVLALYAATEVARSRGASVEAEFRERASQHPSDPVARVGLAWAITWRHAEPGPWCDEVQDLVGSVEKGDPHAWAVIAEREKEYRCDGGNTDHADAELAKLSRDDTSPAWIDGVLARSRPGAYIRPETADDLEALWSVAPHRLDRAPGLWARSTSGPAEGRARRLTRRALAAAADSAQPSAVWAALKAYRALGRERDARSASYQLARLDPNAQTDLGRDRHAIADPPIYATIDGCFDATTEAAVRGCAAALPDPPGGAVAAYLHYRRFLAFRAFGEPEVALTEAMAAWEDEPSLTSYARSVVVAALEIEAPSPEQLAAARSATEFLLAAEPDIERSNTTVARRWARDFELAGRLFERAGDSSRAGDCYLRSFALDPTVARRLQLGRALADAGQPAPAVLHLTRGLVETEDEDPSLVRDARRRLDALASTWGRRNANQILQEALGGEGLASPLIDEVLEAETWGWPDETGDGAPIKVAVLWDPRFDDAKAPLAALKAVAAFAAEEEDVSALSVDVGQKKGALPEGIDLPHLSRGPLAVQSLRLVAIPSVLVLDADYRLRAVVSPFDGGRVAEGRLAKAVEALRKPDE